MCSEMRDFDGDLNLIVGFETIVVQVVVASILIVFVARYLLDSQDCF